VPKDVVDKVGRSEIWKTLGTGNHRKAVSLYHQVRADMDAQFKIIRRNRDVTDTELRRLVTVWFEGMDRRVAVGIGAAFDDARREALAALNVDEGVLLNGHEEEWAPAVQKQADALLAAANITLDKTGERYRAMCNDARRAMLETVKRSRSRLEGEGDRTYDAMFAGLDHGGPSDAGLSVTEVAARWVEEGAPTWTKRTRQDFEATVRMFVEVVGDKPIKSVARTDARDFKDMLVKSPATMSRRHKGLTLPQAVKAGKDSPRLAAMTVNKYLAALAVLFSWSLMNGYVDLNPVVGLRVALDKRADKQRRPFTPDELRMVFAALDGKAGSALWLPLLGAFTGARLGELCQLEADDVRARDGVDVISINDEGDKELKAKSSVREVPVHPTLIELGFLDFVADARARGGGRLFDVISTSYSKKFGRFRRALGVTGRDVGFHSFRHNVADRLRNAGVELEMRNAILGHAQSAMGARYGAGFSVAVLRAAIRKIDYDLDLSHLRAG
jgi:integrase